MAGTVRSERYFCGLTISRQGMSMVGSELPGYPENLSLTHWPHTMLSLESPRISSPSCKEKSTFLTLLLKLKEWLSLGLVMVGLVARDKK